MAGERSRRRRVVCAPDKLRDATTAREAADALAAGAERAGWRADPFPVADGGEGTLEIVRARVGGVVYDIESLDALARSASARFGLLPDSTGVVVAADVIGLEQLAEDERDPMRATSRGLAAPVLAALAMGVRRLVVFVGGTANIDGGLGFLVGLGAVARDAVGRRLEGTGEDLTRLASLDLTRSRAAVETADIVLASDVGSPLIGPNGATWIFGPQKGASVEQISQLDTAMGQLAELVGLDAFTPGAGAAGGLGYAFLTLGGRRVSGADLVLEMTGFADVIREADLCLTGEGKVDGSSSAGKAVGAVLAVCRTAGVPCVVLGGELTPEAERLYDAGAAAVMSISRGVRSLPEALEAAIDDLTAAAQSACELVDAVLPPANGCPT